MVRRQRQCGSEARDLATLYRQAGVTRGVPLDRSAGIDSAFNLRQQTSPLGAEPGQRKAGYLYRSGGSEGFERQLGLYCSSLLAISRQRKGPSAGGGLR